VQIVVYADETGTQGIQKGKEPARAFMDLWTRWSLGIGFVLDGKML